MSLSWAIGKSGLSGLIIQSHHSVVARTNVLVLGLVGGEPRAASCRLSGYTSPPPFGNSPDLARRLESFFMPGSSAKPEWHLRTSGSGVEWDNLGDFDVRTGFRV